MAYQVETEIMATPACQVECTFTINENENHLSPSIWKEHRSSCIWLICLPRPDFYPESYF